MAEFYNSYSDYLKKRFGYRIYKVGVSAGFTCPHRDVETGKGGCVFCDELGATASYLRTNESKYGRKAEFENSELKNAVPEQLSDLKSQIERGREFLKRRYGAEHFALYFQSFSNTYGSVERLKKIYDYGLAGRSWDELVISTRPDCLDKEKLSLISSYKNSTGNVCVELGLQSGSDRILALMNRGHDVQTYMIWANEVKKAGLQLCTHVLLGFPTETEEDLQMTIRALNVSKPDFVKFHNLNIVKNTKLYQDYLLGVVRAPTAEEYLQILTYVLRRISEDIVIQRLICETPAHRLASPRDFPDKNTFIRMLDYYLSEHEIRQGDLKK